MNSIPQTYLPSSYRESDILCAWDVKVNMTERSNSSEWEQGGIMSEQPSQWHTLLSLMFDCNYMKFFIIF